MKIPKVPIRIFRSEFTRNAFTLISGTSFAQGISFVVYLILPAFYSPEDFGLLALYLSILSITMIISTGKYELAIMLPAEEGNAKSLLELTVSISAVFSLLLIIAVAIFRKSFAHLLGNRDIAPWLFLIPLSTFLVGCFQAFRYYQNRKKKYKIIASANIGQSFTNSSIKLAMGPLAEGPMGLVTGTVMGQLTGFAIFFHKTIQGGFRIFRKVNVRRMLALGKEYSLFPRFNMLQGLVNNFSGALPIFVLTSQFSAAIAGYFSLGYTIIYRPMNLVVSAVFQVLFQNIMEKHNRGERIYPDIRRFLVRMIQLVTIPFLLLLFLSPLIFRIFPEEWEEAGRYTQLLVPWLFMVSLTMPLSFIPDIFKMQKTAFVIDLFKFILRAAALLAGVMAGDVYLAVVLFSSGSAVIILLTLVWYISLVKRAEKTRGR